MKRETKLILYLTFMLIVLVFVIAVPEFGIVVAAGFLISWTYKKISHIPIIQIKRK